MSDSNQDEVEKAVIYSLGTEIGRVRLDRVVDMPTFSDSQPDYVLGAERAKDVVTHNFHSKKPVYGAGSTESGENSRTVVLIIKTDKADKLEFTV